MGIFSDLNQWAAKEVFLDSAVGPAEEVEIVPSGDWSRVVTAIAVVTRDSLPGTNEVRGDGVALERPAGRTIRETLVADLSNCLEIPVGRNNSTLMRLSDGTIWVAVRIQGKDDSLQSVIFARSQDIQLRNESKR
jgi:hypothetical protein